MQKLTIVLSVTALLTGCFDNSPDKATFQFNSPTKQKNFVRATAGAPFQLEITYLSESDYADMKKSVGRISMLNDIGKGNFIDNGLIQNPDYSSVKGLMSQYNEQVREATVLFDKSIEEMKGSLTSQQKEKYDGLERWARVEKEHLAFVAAEQKELEVAESKRSQLLEQRRKIEDRVIVAVNQHITDHSLDALTSDNMLTNIRIDTKGINAFGDCEGQYVGKYIQRHIKLNDGECRSMALDASIEQGPNVSELVSSIESDLESYYLVDAKFKKAHFGRHQAKLQFDKKTAIANRTFGSLKSIARTKEAYAKEVQALERKIKTDMYKAGGEKFYSDYTASVVKQIHMMMSAVVQADLKELLDSKHTETINLDHFGSAFDFEYSEHDYAVVTLHSDEFEPNVQRNTFLDLRTDLSYRGKDTPLVLPAESVIVTPSTSYFLMSSLYLF